MFSRKFQSRTKHFILKSRGVLFPLAAAAGALLLVEGTLVLMGVESTWSERNFGAYERLYREEPFWDGLDRRPPSDESWSYSCAEYTSRFPVNSLGFFDRPRSPEKPPDTIRVLAIGDSFTQGVGIVPGQRSYPAFLEEKLNRAERRDGIRWEVWNLGICSADPVQEYLILEREALAYRPDWVVVLFNIADRSDLELRGGFARLDPGRAREIERLRARFRRRERWFRASRLVRILFKRVLKMDGTLRMKWERGPLFGRSAEGETLEAMLRFRRLSREHGFGLVIGLLDGNEPSMQALFQRMRERNIPGFLFQFDPDHPRDRFQWPGDRHFRGRGYRLLAARVYRALVREAARGRGPAPGEEE